MSGGSSSAIESSLPDLVRGVRSRGSLASGSGGGREGSDTSSAYSGSDTMCHSVHSLDHDDVDLSGLMESVVDSDEEDLAESIEVRVMLAFFTFYFAVEMETFPIFSVLCFIESTRGN